MLFAISLRNTVQENHKKTDIKSFYAHGKLMLTAEYLVLHGARSLALPLKMGQKMKLIPKKQGAERSKWTNYYENDIWFQGSINKNLEVGTNHDRAIAERLQHILKQLYEMNPGFESELQKYDIENILEFDPSWGLGSSSTLISNLAEWAGVDPYQLLAKTFGGSGYDLACAKSDQAVLYAINDGQPRVVKLTYLPPFRKHILFVYLGQKQSSGKEIARFRNKIARDQDIERVDNITNAVLHCRDILDFMELIREHEQILSGILKRDRIKDVLFNDFEGEIKSLGAWGGDFVMAVSDNDPGDIRDYFLQKDFNVFFNWDELTL